ncbi:hypothetical protein LRS07_08910 [Aquabacterium sp. J223]|nr:tripartite tricarboxylate transporter substrate-binding protein [Aquabacterium sp. J223]UUX97341.1 hypothetical protein LRS07_08910 [Aquabacterium sp. J223]
MKSRLLRLLLVAAGLFAVPLSQAQDYPNRPIRFILSQGPGGTTDAVARTIAQKLGERLGTQVVVENRAGANGILAAEAVARAAPDGYTITLGSSSTNAINPSLYRQLPYDALRDFTPISMAGKAYYVVVVHPSVPANSLKALIALAKSKPGGSTMARAAARRGSAARCSTWRPACRSTTSRTRLRRRR